MENKTCLKYKSLGGQGRRSTHPTDPNKWDEGSWY